MKYSLIPILHLLTQDHLLLLRKRPRRRLFTRPRPPLKSRCGII